MNTLISLLILIVLLALSLIVIMLISIVATKIAVLFGAPLAIEDTITNFLLTTAVFGFIAYMQYKNPSFIKDCDCECSKKDCNAPKKDEFSALPFIVILFLYLAVLKISV